MENTWTLPGFGVELQPVCIFFLPLSVFPFFLQALPVFLSSHLFHNLSLFTPSSPCSLSFFYIQFQRCWGGVVCLYDVPVTMPQGAPFPCWSAPQNRLRHALLCTISDGNDVLQYLQPLFKKDQNCAELGRKESLQFIGTLPAANYLEREEDWTGNVAAKHFSPSFSKILLGWNYTEHFTVAVLVFSVAAAGLLF